MARERIKKTSEKKIDSVYLWHKINYLSLCCETMNVLALTYNNNELYK